MALVVLLLTGCLCGPRTAAGTGTPARASAAAATVDSEAPTEPRTPEGEFTRNLADRRLAFYCYGSPAHGYRYPGVTQEQLDRFLKGGAAQSVVYWSDDPLDVLSEVESFESMTDFLARYNRLVLDYLEKRERESRDAAS
jgi:hypothetical protein